MSDALARLTEGSHLRCYETSECLSLPGKRPNGMSLAEIRLAHCDDGWRASHGFGFTGGDSWGSWSPIFASSAAHPSREAAIEAEVQRLRDRIKDREGPEPNGIRSWLDTLLTPNLLDRMTA